MERLESDVRREFARFGPAAGMAELVAAWPAAVGEAIAKNAWPARIARDGTLYVHTADSVWAFELGQREEQIRAALGPLAPAAIRFAPGKIPDVPVEATPEARRDVPMPTREDRARAAELAAPIANEELRELVARAAAASLHSRPSDRSV